jgi:hypothetical protein
MSRRRRIWTNNMKDNEEKTNKNENKGKEGKKKMKGK